MWLKVWTWATGNKLLAIAIVALGVIALGSVADGWSARRAATRYFDLAKGWAAAYQRDTTASRQAYEAKIRALTADRDSYRKKYDLARGKMGAPWIPPKGAKALQERFNRMGYRGRLK